VKARLGERLQLALVPPLAAGFIRLLHWTQNLDIIGEEGPREFWDRGERVILSLWHDQILLMIPSYRGPGTRLLISQSRDGELLARTMHRFGQGTIRGSSSRKGRAAFREMVQLTTEPFDFGITPDGPRGPRHQLKPGVVELARLTGRPVIPLAFACSRGHRFGSWDRFLLPYPFGRAVFCYGPPLRIAPGEDRTAFGERLQAAMEENDRRAQAHLEEHGVSAV
jgi:lysophospholipid acyltransferase (LPLAT)-like uncharacterized protein